jgi:hypothetical protein
MTAPAPGQLTIDEDQKESKQDQKEVALDSRKISIIPTRS